jgi:L-threonate 2-dehydrogenase
MVAPRLATMFASGDLARIDMVRPTHNAVSGLWVYAGPFGTGAPMKCMANVLLAVHAITDGETLARRSGLGLELVRGTLEGSDADWANWTQRRPWMAAHPWTPAPGPVRTLRPIHEQIEGSAAAADLSAAVFASGQLAFANALAGGSGDVGTACAHDQVSGMSVLSPGDPS